MRKLLPVVLFLVLALGIGQYMRLDDSKKRFIKHLVKQVPYLPGRYFA